MKRRDFLKLTMGALGAGMGIKATQAAKPLFIGVDLATPGADKTVYLPVNKKNYRKQGCWISSRINSRHDI